MRVNMPLPACHRGYGLHLSILVSKDPLLKPLSSLSSRYVGSVSDLENSLTF